MLTGTDPQPNVMWELRNLWKTGSKIAGPRGVKDTTNTKTQHQLTWPHKGSQRLN